MVNDDLPNRVLSGTLTVKGNIQKFTDSGVYFEDGEFQEIDCVVFATGYNFSYPFLDKSIINVGILKKIKYLKIREDFACR